MRSDSWWLRRIEDKAYARLRELRQRELWDGTPPIPIDHVLEHLLGLSIVWERIEEQEGEQIFGCLRPDDRQVVLNEANLPLFAEKPGLERFSKAHEAGHADVFALAGEQDQLKLFAQTHYRPQRRSAPGGDVVFITDRLRGLDSDVRTHVLHAMRDSARRRRIAGEDSALEKRAVDHYAAILLMPEDAVRHECRGRDLSRWDSLYDLARAFEVTISAMIVRLKELGLLFDVRDRLILLRDPNGVNQRELF